MLWKYQMRYLPGSSLMFGCVASFLLSSCTAGGAPPERTGEPREIPCAASGLQAYWRAKLTYRVANLQTADLNNRVRCAGRLPSGEIVLLVGGWFRNHTHVPAQVIVLTEGAGGQLKETSARDLPQDVDPDCAEWDSEGFFVAQFSALVIGPIEASGSGEINVVRVPPIDTGEVLAIARSARPQEYYALFADLGRDSVTPQEYRLKKFKASSDEALQTTVLGPVLFDNAFSSSDIRGFIRRSGNTLWVFGPGGNAWTVDTLAGTATEQLSERDWREGTDFARHHSWDWALICKTAIAGDYSSLWLMGPTKTRLHPFGLLHATFGAVSANPVSHEIYIADRISYDEMGLTCVSIERGTATCRPIGRPREVVLEDSEAVVSVVPVRASDVLVITDRGRIWRVDLDQ